MAVPRKRKSRARRGNQRSHDALSRPVLSGCPNCGAKRLPHRMCGSCGWYHNRTVIDLEAE